ncbi:MAG: nuclear transport factor 2 family protein [Frankiales bacterium]|nr:nuclear transport factor 2 family protein [Frankiales bacterium]
MMTDDTAGDTAARLAIHELVARYNMSWDSDDVDGVLSCFSADGVFIDAAGGQHRGHSAIRAFVSASPAAFGKMRHITSSHLVELQAGGRARHRCYVVFVSHPEGQRVLDTGEYEDAVELAAGSWRFTSRTVTFD